MLEEINFCRTENLSYCVAAKSFTPISNRNLCLISINDWTRIPREFPDYFRPVLKLEFSTDDPLKNLGMPPATKNMMAHIRHKTRFDELKRRNPNLPSESQAEKIIIFINELFKDKNNWELWIVCPDGRRSSASIARFVEAMGICPSIKSHDCVSTEWHNIYLSALLAYTYGKLFKSQLAAAAAEEKIKHHESNANPESVVRGKEDNSPV